MLPIQRKISSYNHYVGNNIKYIVIHYTGNKGDTALANATYFYGGNRGASAHYFVDDNSIWQSVEDSNGAWHVGDGHGRYGITNTNSIGIEQCCNKSGVISEKTENNCIELVRHLMNKYKIDINHVVRHYDASRKTCPNWQNNNWERWWKFKEKIKSGVTNRLEEQELIVNLKDYFVEDYYREKNPDVVAVYGTSREGLYRHYIDYGKKEGRKPNAYPDDWNEAYYLLNNPDVLANVNTGRSFVSGLHHYIIVGYKENRSYAMPKILMNEKVNQEEMSKILGATLYRVVAGSFREKDNANRRQKELKDKGFESFIEAKNV